MTHGAHNDEWGDLAAQWRSVPERPATPVADIRRRVMAQTIRLYLFAGIEVLITVGALVWLALALPRADDLHVRLLLIGLLVFTLSIWAFTVRNRRGTWRPAARTLEGYRALERLRLQRRLASTQFVWRFCSMTLVAAAAWTAWRIDDLSAPQLWVMVGTAIYLAIWIAGALIVGRRVAEQLERSRVDDEE